MAGEAVIQGREERLPTILVALGILGNSHSPTVDWGLQKPLATRGGSGLLKAQGVRKAPSISLPALGEAKAVDCLDTSCD